MDVEVVMSDKVAGKYGGGEGIKEEAIGAEMEGGADSEAAIRAGVSDSQREDGQQGSVDGDGDGDLAKQDKGKEVQGVGSSSDLGGKDTTGGGLVCHEIDNSHLLGATMTAVGKSGQEENTSTVPAAGAVALEAEVSQMGVNEELINSGNVSTRGGRKKRGRQPKVQAPKLFVKKGEEDVCFICFDGGDLVVCDRRGCPKVYHPSCINREESFFKAKGRWNCGWHICSICEKAAQFMCYTCTYSLCKSCIKQSEFVCIRGNKGLCQTCRGMVMLLETNDPAAVNFYDKNSWEYLFKDYWTDVKQKLSLSFDEISKGKKSLKKAVVHNDTSGHIYNANDGVASSSDSSSRRGNKTRKRAKRRHNVMSNEESSVTVVDSVGSSVPGDGEWASKELLELVSHMKDGDTSVLSQFDVETLLLEYIKRNKLRDPWRKSQILCDFRLQSLFGKARVGRFEMLELLESHFLIKEDSHIAVGGDQMPVGDPASKRMVVEGSSDAVRMVLEKKRKGRKKENREAHAHFDDNAAIDSHNIGLIYLKRSLVEEMLDDAENLNEKVVGSFIRIRIPASSQRLDMYRLVKVIGTTKASEKYQTGKKTTDILLEILNLNKTETISIDTISNQEFTEEECKRLRQSIKYGFLPRMRVGELQEKAQDLQTIKVNDWLEAEKTRLVHLRDRASDMGHRKELRECVEKLASLPEGHARRLNEIPNVHSDFKMDPNYESAEEDPADQKQDNMHRSRSSGNVRKGNDNIPSEKGSMASEIWNGNRKCSPMTSDSRGAGDVVVSPNDALEGTMWGRGKDMLQQNSLDLQGNRGKTPNLLDFSQSIQVAGQIRSSANASVSTPSSLTTNVAPMGLSIIESEKIWHYQDPTGKIQGPFSMVQLRKWNSTGYFPRDLRIWKTTEKQEESILLSNALIGKFERELPELGSQQTFNHRSPKFANIIDGRDANTRGSNDSSTLAEKQLSIPHRSDIPGTQEQGSTQQPAAILQCNVSTFDGHLVASSFQQFPSQQANLQSVASGFGINPGLGPNSSNSSVLATSNPNATSSAGTNKSRPRVSRWEPESDAMVIQPSTGLSGKSSTATVLGNASALLVSMDSPTPKYNQLGNCSAADDIQKGFTSTTHILTANDISSSASSPPLVKLVGLSGHNISNVEIKPEFQKLDSTLDDPNMQNNFSPIRVQSSEIPNTTPEIVGGIKQSPTSVAVLLGQQHSSSGNPIASVNLKNTEWSMPSPTPNSEVARVDATAQVALANNSQAFSDSSRLAASVQLKSTSSIGPAQVPPQQMQGTMVNQISDWAFGPENSGITTTTTQTTTGWVPALPANANMGWVAPGASTIGWSAPPQGNTAVVGWNPASAGASVANTVPQVAVQGTMNPVPGWGTVGQVIPPINAGWGAPMQQVNANPGWGVAMQGAPNGNPCWGLPPPANADPNMGWGAQVPGNPNANGGRGMPNGNANAGWNLPTGNPNTRGSHQRDRKDRYGYGDSIHDGGRQRMHSSGGGPTRDPQGQRGICRFHENGHCRRGASCNYLHS